MNNLKESTKKNLRIGVVVASILGILFVGKWYFFPSNRVAELPLLNSQSNLRLAVVKDTIQEVSIDLKSRAFDPIVVQKGIPVKFNIKATRETLNSCNGTIIIPEYNIERTLLPGDNIIEFTPDNEGTIAYSCWMGMIGSSIQVVPDLSKADLNASQVQGANGVGSSCCTRP